MNLSEFTVRLIILFLPGIIAFLTIRSLTELKHKTKIDNPGKENVPWTGKLFSLEIIPEFSLYYLPPALYVYSSPEEIYCLICPDKREIKAAYAYGIE